MSYSKHKYGKPSCLFIEVFQIATLESESFKYPRKLCQSGRDDQTNRWTKLKKLLYAKINTKNGQIGSQSQNVVPGKPR